ncbi:hypothetical protein LTR53_011138 [Teratosphaeriaceae sp. CCFEE 6253]|nr:hypothetical protein LTR53_011138 [Teratosphaeriaceae sp. CCFEE 6253]
MAFAWKAAGITYNRYLAVAARVVRRSLKDDKRLVAERRGEMDLRFAKWEVSRALNPAAQSKKSCREAEGAGKGGKQGENKSLADANQAGMAEHAGQ